VLASPAPSECRVAKVSRTYTNKFSAHSLFFKNDPDLRTQIEISSAQLPTTTLAKNDATKLSELC
jgi:hypothetical protein